MGGGLLQLVAYGAQDVYLTGNPQITFFKVVYRRHTNFSIEAIEQTINGNSNFNSRVTIQLTRNGDLINRIYFNAVLTNGTSPNTDSATTNNGFALVPYFGHKLLKTIELEIGGQRIDKHYSEWLYIWNELSLPASKKDGYRLMVGGDVYNRSIYLGAGQSYEINVPLEFWFCRNVGLALPLIALQYHEVKVNIEYASQAEMVDKATTNFCDRAYNLTADSGARINPPSNGALTGAVTALTFTSATMWVDYIFLDTDERRRFAQLSHEYLIEQLQFTGTDTITGSGVIDNMKSLRMNFNHPCKELIWVIHSTANTNSYWNNFSDCDVSAAGNNYVTAKNPVLQAKIQLNGNDRMAQRPGTYFSRVQPYQHHENCPSVFNQGINVYSFAIKPEDHQPSGTLNMSRIDTAMLSVASSITGAIYIFTVNYNVLRILSGMGGLAYSN